ncbi:MAG: hypothetical protein ACRDOE_26065, partial [Streptosporangiaceae bacterium]
MVYVPALQGHPASCTRRRHTQSTDLPALQLLIQVKAERDNERPGTVMSGALIQPQSLGSRVAGCAAHDGACEVQA